MEARHDIALVPVVGDVSVRTAPRLRSTLARLMDGGTKRIVLNMAEVPFVDSAGMGVIIGAVRTMRKRGGLLSLVNVRREVLRSLAIARLVDFCPVSAMGARREVAELAPGTLPLWRTTLPVDADDLSATRERISSLAGDVFHDQDTLFDVTLAAGEALGNAVDHTSGEDILATVSAYPDRLVVEVSDCGQGFALDQVEACPSCEAERGRGLTLMRLLVDSVSVSRRAGGTGTVVSLTKLV